MPYTPRLRLLYYDTPLKFETIDRWVMCPHGFDKHTVPALYQTETQGKKIIAEGTGKTEAEVREMRMQYRYRSMPYFFS